MNVNEVAKNFTGQSGLAYGIDTAIKALRPNAKFEMSVVEVLLIFHDGKSSRWKSTTNKR